MTFQSYDRRVGGWLLDTNIISAAIGGRALDPRLKHFFETVRDERLHLSVLTIGELRKGIALLPNEANKRTILSTKLSELETEWSDRVLPIDTAIAGEWGLLSAACQQRGMPIPVVDGLIAATARVRNLGVASNDKAFARLGSELVVYNPLSD